MAALAAALSACGLIAPASAGRCAGPGAVHEDRLQPSTCGRAPSPVGDNDADTSAREGIVPAVNGPRGVSNPQRQGLESALLSQGDPLNTMREESGDYSPVWDVTPLVWTVPNIGLGDATGGASLRATSATLVGWLSPQHR